MEIETTYRLKISKAESTVLVKLLGNLTDVEMYDKGLSPEEVAIIHEAWGILPSYNEEISE